MGKTKAEKAAESAEAKRLADEAAANAEQYGDVAQDGQDREEGATTAPAKKPGLPEAAVPVDVQVTVTHAKTVKPDDIALITVTEDPPPTPLRRGRFGR